MKFHRIYKITIQTYGADGLPSDEAIVITPPFTVRFDVRRQIGSTTNALTMFIYNLSKSTRNKIFHDRYQTTNYNRIIFEAGYGGELSVIFSGNIFQANSVREGSNIVTFINAFDGNFDTTNSQTYITLKAGTTRKELVNNLINRFQYLKPGAIGDLPGTFERPVVLEGSTIGLINKYTNNLTYIDLEKVNIQKYNEVVDGIIPVLDASTGLINTPQRDDTYLCATTIFEPRVVMGQIINLLSTIQNPKYNGDYKVIGINHNGVISEAVSGNCHSTFQLLLGAQFFGSFKKIPNG